MFPNNVDRPEKKELEKFVDERMKEIFAPQIMAIQDAENPEEVLSEFMHSLEDQSQAEANQDEAAKGPQ